MLSNLSRLQPSNASSPAITLKSKHGRAIATNNNVITSIQLNGRELIHPEAANEAETRARILKAACNYARQGDNVVTAGVPYPIPDLNYHVLNGNKISVSLTADGTGFNVNVWYYNSPHTSYLAEEAGKKHTPASILYLPSPQIVSNVPEQGATLYLSQQNAQIRVLFGPTVSAVATNSIFSPDCVDFTIHGPAQQLSYQQTSPTITYQFWLENVA